MSPDRTTTQVGRPADGPGRPSPHRIQTIVRRLEKKYGRRPWQKHGPPLDGLIATLLSQNTTDLNSNAAYCQLKKDFPTWEQVRKAPVAKIAAAIHPGGLANRKAPRIQKILNQLHERTGRLSLDFLADLPLEQARDYLASFVGVGPKTAACVLLFHFGRLALPVDTHVYRLARRLALIGPRTSVERAHKVLEKACPDQLIYPFHVLLITHGRRICHARDPECPACCLNDICPSRPALESDFPLPQRQKGRKRSGNDPRVAGRFGAGKGN